MSFASFWPDGFDAHIHQELLRNGEKSKRNTRNLKKLLQRLLTAVRREAVAAGTSKVEDEVAVRIAEVEAVAERKQHPTQMVPKRQSRQMMDGATAPVRPMLRPAPVGIPLRPTGTPRQQVTGGTSSEKMRYPHRRQTSRNLLLPLPSRPQSLVVGLDFSRSLRQLQRELQHPFPERRLKMFLPYRRQPLKSRHPLSP